MIVGNQASVSVLKRYIDNFVQGNKKSVPFFVISGPKNIGKTTIIQDLVKHYLGNFFANDFLYIRDLTQNYDGDIDKIKKNHSLKIELSDKKDEQFLKMSNELEYQDIGIREINFWLQQSKVGIFKAVLLENIERMTIGAANAFLKACEEPLPGRIIFATTSHQSKILDTIISRAIVIKFRELTADEIKTFMREKGYFQGDDTFGDFVCNMAMGRPGVVEKLYHMFEKDDGLKQDFNKLVNILTGSKSIFYAQDILKRLNSNNYLDFFIDGWISFCVDNDMFQQAQKWLKIKKIIKRNVGVENLILYGVL